MLISVVYQALRKSIADSAAPGKSDFYGAQMAPAVVEEILNRGRARMVSG